MIKKPNNRNKITKFCKDHGLEIVNLEYLRMYRTFQGISSGHEFYWSLTIKDTDGCSEFTATIGDETMADVVDEMLENLLKKYNSVLYNLRQTSKVIKELKEHKLPKNVKSIVSISNEIVCEECGLVSELGACILNQNSQLCKRLICPECSKQIEI